MMPKWESVEACPRCQHVFCRTNQVVFRYENLRLIPWDVTATYCPCGSATVWTGRYDHQLRRWKLRAPLMPCHTCSTTTQAYWTSTTRWYDPLTWGGGYWTTLKQWEDAVLLRKAMSGVLDQLPNHKQAPAAET